MSQSIYLTVHIDFEHQRETFDKDVQDAKKIFKEMWQIEGTGFEKNGLIKGMKELYESWNYDSDLKKLYENPLDIVDLSKIEENRFSSFNFHNYRAETWLNDKIPFIKIYYIFAKILSTCFGYSCSVSDSYDEPVEYCCIFNSDGVEHKRLKDEDLKYIEKYRNIKEIEDNKVRLEELKKEQKEIETKLKNDG